MAIGADLIQWAAGIGPSKPKVPDFTPVTLPAAQKTAVAANQAELPAILSLSKGIDSYNEQRRADLLKSIPGFESITGQTSDLISSLLGGQIPKDVSDAVNRASAARSLAGGYSGSGMQANLSARDLGLTSLGLQERGAQMESPFLSNQFALRYVAPSPVESQMFITPGQEAATETSNADRQFSHDWLSNQIASLMDPKLAKVIQGWDSLDDAVTNSLLSYAGGGMGGGMGGMGGGGKVSTPPPNSFAVGGGGVSGSPGGDTGAMGGGGGDWSSMLQGLY